MASMLDVLNQTNAFAFDEESGAILDPVGGRDSTSISGTLAYNGKTVGTDGVTARVNWGSGAGESPWIWSDAGGVAGLIHVINQEESVGLNGLFKVISGVEAGASGPGMNWDDLNVTNSIRVSLYASLQTVTFALGREMNLGEAFVWAWSRNNTGAFVMTLKSDDADDPIDMTITGSGPTASSDRSWHLGGSAGGSNHFKADFATVINVVGMQFTEEELQADSDALLFPENGPTEDQIRRNFFLRGIRNR
jgi:hypothetical protein